MTLLRALTIAIITTSLLAVPALTPRGGQQAGQATITVPVSALQPGDRVVRLENWHNVPGAANPSGTVSHPVATRVDYRGRSCTNLRLSGPTWSSCIPVSFGATAVIRR